jgi:hypothetical protein
MEWHTVWIGIVRSILKESYAVTLNKIQRFKMDTIEYNVF